MLGPQVCVPLEFVRQHSSWQFVEHQVFPVPQSTQQSPMSSQLFPQMQVVADATSGAEKHSTMAIVMVGINKRFLTIVLGDVLMSDLQSLAHWFRFWVLCEGPWLARFYLFECYIDASFLGSALWFLVVNLSLGVDLNVCM